MDPRRPPVLERFVLDASVALAWAFENAADVEELFTKSNLKKAIVPPPWLYEVANGLIDGERRARLISSEADRWRAEFVAMLVDIEVESVDGARCFESVSELARKYRLSVYDSAYFELALRKQIPLATIDRRLREAAIEAGIQVLP